MIWLVGDCHARRERGKLGNSVNYRWTKVSVALLQLSLSRNQDFRDDREQSMHGPRGRQSSESNCVESSHSRYIFHGLRLFQKSNHLPTLSYVISKGHMRPLYYMYYYKPPRFRLGDCPVYRAGALPLPLIKSPPSVSIKTDAPGWTGGQHVSVPHCSGGHRIKHCSCLSALSVTTARKRKTYFCD